MLFSKCRGSWKLEQLDLLSLLVHFYDTCEKIFLEEIRTLKDRWRFPWDLSKDIENFSTRALWDVENFCFENCQGSFSPVCKWLLLLFVEPIFLKKRTVTDLYTDNWPPCTASSLTIKSKIAKNNNRQFSYMSWNSAKVQSAVNLVSLLDQLSRVTVEIIFVSLGNNAWRMKVLKRVSQS